MNKGIKEGLISIAIGAVIGVAMQWDEITDLIELKKDTKRLKAKLERLEEDAKLKALKARLEREAEEARLEDQKMLERFRRRIDVLTMDISEES